jgi:hypothetical protein
MLTHDADVVRDPRGRAGGGRFEHAPVRLVLAGGDATRQAVRSPDQWQRDLVGPGNEAGPAIVAPPDRGWVSSAAPFARDPQRADLLERWLARGALTACLARATDRLVLAERGGFEPPVEV